MPPATLALIVAAGRGNRAGEGIPKQYRPLAGVPILRRTIESFLNHPGIARVAVVIHPHDATLYEVATAGLDGRARLLPPVHGGAARQDSVRLGLEAMTGEPGLVLIHDAARPFVTASLIDAAIAAAVTHRAAIPALAVTDTLARQSDGCLTGDRIDRTGAVAVQTPQAFDLTTIRDAHRKAANANVDGLTDDASVLQWAGGIVHLFPGDPANMKVTGPGDFARAEAHLAQTLGDIRTGSGFDVHAFAPGDHVWLGGVKLPHEAALSGHSDADVALHALTDAILGAIGDGDIGAHFPPSDPQWKGAASDRFLIDACARVSARGGMIAHLDVTIICEAPKIGPHREAMRGRIADICALPLHRVAVKATTSERLGFTGRREGIAAMASATIRLPWRE